MAKDKRANAPVKPNAPATSRTTPAPPAWPVFRPPLPLTDLAPETKVQDKVVILRNFWPKSLCRDYVSFLKTLPLITTPGKPKRGEAVRVNDRFQIEDHRFANRLWLETGLKDALLADAHRHLWGGDVVGLSPNMRVYRYSAGQYFDAHYDDSNTITVQSPETKQPIVTKTTWTLLLYLTSSGEGCEGGETVFYPHDRKVAKEAIAVSPETGMLLLHKHGRDCMLHEGKEVSAGEKWVIRSDLCVRR